MKGKKKEFPKKRQRVGALGRRTARRDALAGVSSVVTNAFAYNLRSEVQSAQMRQDTYSYVYDPIGNRLSSTNGSWGWGLGYTANQLNQYDDLGGSPLAYDADGNCTTNAYAGWLYDWDAENRLAAVWWEYEDSGEDEWESWYYYEAHRTEYQYDHQSRRVGKAVLSRYDSRESPWTTNAVFRYDFDGWNLVRELASYDGVNFTTNSYVWGLDLSGTLQGAGGVGGLVAAFPDAASASTQFLYEPLGTNRAPDVAGWGLQGQYWNWSGGGWNLRNVHMISIYPSIWIEPFGSGSIRSPALDGIGTLHFRARLDLPVYEDHKLAVETATSTSGPWTQIQEVTVPVETQQFTAFHVPVDDPRSGVYLRIRRTTTSSNANLGYIAVREIAISRYSDLSLGLFPAYDANGNVTDLVDANGVHQAHYEYSPFGELASESGTKAGAFPFRFSTKYWDNDAYLYYYGYRWYDPWLGRWVNRDPIGEDGGENLYGSVGNAAIDAVDRLGMLVVYAAKFNTPADPRWNWYADEIIRRLANVATEIASAQVRDRYGEPCVLKVANIDKSEKLAFFAHNGSTGAPEGPDYGILWTKMLGAGTGIVPTKVALAKKPKCCLSWYGSKVQDWLHANNVDYQDWIKPTNGDQSMIVSAQDVVRRVVTLFNEYKCGRDSEVDGERNIMTLVQGVSMPMPPPAWAADPQNPQLQFTAPYPYTRWNSEASPVCSGPLKCEASGE